MQLVDRMRIASSLNNLANYYYSLGDYNKAVELGTQALNIRKQTLGEKHPNYATSLNNLANYYSGLGDYNKAVELGTKTLETIINCFRKANIEIPPSTWRMLSLSRTLTQLPPAVPIIWSTIFLTASTLKC